MKGNYFVCENRVVIEGKPAGKFEKFSYSEERGKLEGSAEILIPVHAIGAQSDPNRNAPPADRVRSALSGLKIMPGAMIEVWGKFADNEMLGHEFDEVLLFRGFIRQVVSGFPTLLICEDNAFILRFGKVSDQKGWHTRSKLSDMTKVVIPIANEAFLAFRKKQGFDKPDAFTPISYDAESSADTDYTLQLSGDVSPYDVLKKLIGMYNFYSRVRPDGALYIGLGIADKTKRTVELHTQRNVIQRDITPKDGMFDNYYVEVNSFDDNGKKITVKLGDSDGESVREYRSIRTQKGLEDFAKSLMNHLLGKRNEGSISTVLYPVIDLYDYVSYTDTLSPELSGNYYVTGKTLNCDESSGFVQTIKITDRRFIL